ncbi:MAG: hypothetical protein KC645_03440 [Gemmatimonadetes bacterium]|nr:hypothetical protein [Gemmatimonadota bacterium]
MSSGPAPLTVGVTGHRRLAALPAEDRTRLEAVLADLLEGLADPTALPPVLVSPLAEGADRLAARTALDAGYRLVVLLPFAAADYERDFADDASVRTFRSLLARSTRTSVVEGSGAGSARSAGYERLGDALIGQVDVVLALWDGAAERGPGGTGQVVRRALRAGRPVVHVGVEPPFPVRLLEGPGATLPPVLARWAASRGLEPERA